MKKTLKIVLISVGALLILACAAVLILIKPISMSIYNDNFGKRFTTSEPWAWSIEDFDELYRE